MYYEFIRAYWHQVRTRKDGATAIEYGLLAALIAVAIIVTVGAVGTALDGTFGEVESGLTGN